LWFRLKDDYQTHPDEIHCYRWNIETIKKGAPINLSLHFVNGGIKPSFLFDLGELKYLTFSDLELPNTCAKTPEGDIFCVIKEKIFAGDCGRDPKGVDEMAHCIFCGQKLEEQPLFPKERLRAFEVVFRANKAAIEN